MGLGDITATVLVKHKHDTKDATRELRKLRGEERERHKALVDQMEAQNKKIDEQIAFWGKVAVGIGAAVAAWKALDAGFETYEKNSRLRAANVNTDLQGLQKATRGLVDDTRLLEFSAAAMNGTFALTQKETEAVLQGALALRKTMGVDLTDAMNRVQQAVNEANAEALKPLGITIKETTGTAEAQKAIIAALSDEYKRLGGNVDQAGDDVTRAKTSFANSVDAIKENLGKIADALSPVVAMIAEAAAWIVRIQQMTGGDNSPSSRGDAGARIRGNISQIDTVLAGRRTAGVGGESVWDPRAGRWVPVSRLVEEKARAERELEGLRKNDFAQGIAESDRIMKSALAKAQAARVNAALGPADAAFRRGRARGSGGGGGGGYDISGSEVDGVSADAIARGFMGAGNTLGAFDGMDGFMGALGASGRNSGAGVNFSGTPDAISEMVRSVNTGSMAFQSFESVVVSSFAAMASGAESFSTALKKALGAQAVDLGMVALKKAAYAFAEGLLYRDPKMFAAAAGYTAAGVGLIALGSEMRGGGGGASAGTAPSVAGIGAGAAAGARSSTTVNLIGEDFGEMPARARVAYARRQARRAGIVFEGDAVERV